MNKFLSLLFLGFLLLGCAAPAPPESPSLPGTGPFPPSPSLVTVQEGDAIEVDYLGTFDDGTVFDTNIQEEAQKAGLPLRGSYPPLGFTVGAGQVIEGFEQGVLGMQEGEEKNITIPAAQAYGEIQEDLVLEVNRSELSFGEEDISPGAVIETSTNMKGIVTEVTPDTIAVDFNHPLAGKTLHFKIIVRAITRN